MATKKAASNNNYYLILLLIVVMTIVATAFVGKMLLGSANQNAKVLGAKNKAASQLAKNVEAAPKLVQAYEDAGDQKSTLSEALPVSEDFSGLIALMENMSNASSINLKEISPNGALTVGAVAAPVPGTGTSVSTTTAKVGAPTPKDVPFTLTLGGTYSSLGQMLTNLELSARPMRVTSIEMSGSGSDLAITLAGKTYYQDKATLPIGKEMVK